MGGGEQRDAERTGGAYLDEHSRGGSRLEWKYNERDPRGTVEKEEGVKTPRGRTKEPAFNRPSLEEG